MRFICALFVIVSCALLSFVCIGDDQVANMAPNNDMNNISQPELQIEKLNQEILKLKLENKKLESFWGQLPSYATFLTALVAIIGVIVTIWKQINERAHDREQREEESLRRLDEKFTSIVTNLGSGSHSIQSSAAVSIITFLKPEYEFFHDQVYLILLANLKIQYDQVINKLLIKGFEKAIRIKLQSERGNNAHLDIDLSRSYLGQIDLSELNLNQVDLAFADLKGANLTGSNMSRVRGMKTNFEKARISRANLNEARFRKAIFKDAQFHESNLVSARLEETDLRKAQFQQAKLQSAHFNNANLNGAKFEQADINDAFFFGAIMDEQAIGSILNAKNWQKAHFDHEIEAKLESLSQNRS